MLRSQRLGCGNRQSLEYRHGRRAPARADIALQKRRSLTDVGAGQGGDREHTASHGDEVPPA